jgi:type I restriction enzyme, S subunit
LGADVGSKRLFEIHPGDLLFSNVFAWEGAVAVAMSQDAGRYGSHRFITCSPRSGVATSPFLCFYFLTGAGLRQLGDASPGGAGRNRTLGLSALERIQVPVPTIDRQVWFDELTEKVDALAALQRATTVGMNAILPSVLSRAFKGEL